MGKAGMSKDRLPRFVQPVYQASKREHEQHQCAEQDFRDFQVRLGDRVVSGFLVRRQGNRASEHAGDRIPMLANVSDLSACQPQLRGSGRAEHPEKHPGPEVCHSSKIEHDCETGQPVVTGRRLGHAGRTIIVSTSSSRFA